MCLHVRPDNTPLNGRHPEPDQGVKDGHKEEVLVIQDI